MPEKNGTWNCKLCLTNPIKSNKIKQLCIGLQEMQVKQNPFFSALHEEAAWAEFELLLYSHSEAAKIWLHAIENRTNKNNHLKYETRMESLILFFSFIQIHEPRGGFATHFLFLHFIANLIYSWQKNQQRKNEEIVEYWHMEATSLNVFFLYRLWNFDWRHEAYNTTQLCDSVSMLKDGSNNCNEWRRISS